MSGALDALRRGQAVVVLQDVVVPLVLRHVGTPDGDVTARQAVRGDELGHGGAAVAGLTGQAAWHLDEYDVQHWFSVFMWKRGGSRN